MQTLTAGELIVNGVRVAAIWLRDNCLCAECRDAGTGQKLFDITDLADNVSIAGQTSLAAR
jgi:hypothetical protein